MRYFVDNNSCSVASFEELKDVIDLLSGSSTSSLSLNQPLEIDKTTVDKVVNKKEDGLKKDTGVKGKVSPSDSGIGSTISVQSHPSVSSIVKLNGNEPAITTSAGISTASISKNLSCETEEEQEDIVEYSESSTLLRESIVSDGEEDSRIEDAEVEMLTNDTRSQDDEVTDERDDDETPSNGKNTEFLTIGPVHLNEIAPEVEQEKKLSDVHGNQDENQRKSDIQSSRENSEGENVGRERFEMDSNERWADFFALFAFAISQLRKLKTFALK